MKTRCPACGATSSLDALLGHGDASQAFMSCLSLVGELQKPLVKYLDLFRPDSRDLTFERTAKLLNEIAPDIVAKQIQRNRQTFPAPLGAWVWAIGVLLERRDQSKIDLPLKSHGYLYEVITSYKPEQHVVLESKPRQIASEKSHFQREKERREHEQHKHEKPAVSFGEMMAFTQMNTKQSERGLKNIPTEQLMAHVSQHKQPNESLEQCYQRLKALEQQEQGVIL